MKKNIYVKRDDRGMKKKAGEGREEEREREIIKENTVY